MIVIDNRDIGQRIRKLRMDQKLTQQKLADVVGITHNEISRLEPGIRRAPLEVLAELSLYFDVTLDYLILGK